MDTNNGFQSYQFAIDKSNYSQYFLFRYFPSYQRLESFLINGIYMTSADKFSDHLECVDYNSLLETIKQNAFAQMRAEHNPHMVKNEFNESITAANEKLEKLANKIYCRQKVYHISCWYITQNDCENELMWRSYGGNTNTDDHGFLIRINLKDFISHIPWMKSHNPHNNIIYGNVSYHDFNKKTSIQKVKYTGFRKHKAFEDEKEFRMVYKNEAGRPIENLFLRVPISFYQDISIFAHPLYDLENVAKLRETLESKYKVSLEPSSLYIWYQLKKKLNEADKN